MSEFLQAGELDLFVSFNLVLAAVAYLMGIHRSRLMSGLRWPIWQSACFFTGIALLALAYLGPLGAWGHTFFWVHMTQHLLVTMASAPLIVLGAPITLAFRASGPANRRRIVRVLRTRTVGFLTNPVVTWLLFAGVLLGAHFTPFYDWSLSNHGVAVMVEQPMFLIAALLYYLPLIGGNLVPNRPPHSTRLISLALMMIPEATIGAVIYFSPVILYDSFDTIRTFGPDAKTDQQMSGALMWGLVMVIDSFWMMWVAAEWWSSEERRGRREDALIEAERVSGSAGGSSSG
jgi:cytochrome c oxidase assembly factor CtaG